jgi:hypothetical protein
MMTDINKALAAAILRLLRPLVRILLRNGVSYGAFSDLAKWVFVDVAEKEFKLDGRKQSASRVSLLTGLSRKEVSRLQSITTPDDEAVMQQYNRAARVISGWVHDARFHGNDGEPRPLPLEGEGASFSRLVRDFSGDVPARAILDELVRVGAVVSVGESVELRTRAYVPQSGENDKLGILGSDVAALIATIDHNLRHGVNAPRYQRKLSYDNVPSESIEQLRQLSAERAQALLEELDGEWRQHDRDVNPDVPGTGRKRAGVGIYYFEEDAPEEE